MKIGAFLVIVMDKKKFFLIIIGIGFLLIIVGVIISTSPPPVNDLSATPEKGPKGSSAKELKSKPYHPIPKFVPKPNLPPEKVKFKLAETEDPEEKMILMANLTGKKDDESIAILKSMLQDEDAEVRREAIEILGQAESEKIIPAIKQALQDKDADVRTSAVFAVGALDANELLLTGLNDKAENVREAVFDLIEDRDPAVQQQICKFGLHTAYADNREKALSLLPAINSPETMEIMIDAMKINDPKMQEQIIHSLEFLVGEQFKNYADAAEWWQKNKNKYDEELNLKDSEALKRD